MDIVVSVTEGSENLKADGKIYDIIKQLKTDNTYIVNGRPCYFSQELDFKVVHDGVSRRVESISELGGAVFELDKGKLVAKDSTKHQGGEVVCRFTRQTVDRCAWAVVQMHKENWVRDPELEFKSELQFKTFLAAQSDEVGDILNRLAEDNTSRGAIRSRMKLVLVQGGVDHGMLGMVNKGEVFKLTLDNDTVFDTKVALEVIQATSIHFCLKLGQKTVPDLSMLSNQVIRDLPNPPVVVQTGDREWIPSIGQLVNVEGRKETFVIDDYDQANDKFFLIIADSTMRHDDMINHRRDKCRRFIVSAPNLRPKVLRMSNPA